MRYILLLLVVSISFLTKLEAQSNYGITAFGTNRITARQIKEEYSTELEVLLKQYYENRAEFRIQKLTLEEKLNEGQYFSYVHIDLFKSYTDKIDFIIDFVENDESEVRMAYRKVESKELKDPDHVIKKWIAYSIASKKLFDNGEIKDINCPVVHCTWSFNHPELTPFLTYFENNVPKNTSALKEILFYSNSAEYREAAAYLLAHAKLEIQSLVSTLEPTIDDPSSLVRNAGMRVIYYAVRADNELKIPLDKVITALNYPSFTDRNKALVILRSLPKSRFSREQLKKFLPILFEILQKKDAHNYRNAHTVLKNISGKDFSDTDIDKWEEWIKAVIY
ncbi:MAG: hypothetical protein RLO12_08045 [Fulvivirga sp.]